MVTAGSAGQPGWKVLCDTVEDAIADPGDGFEDLEELFDAYELDMPLPTSLAEVESIQSMKFDLGVSMEAPSDLFSHPDGSTQTRLLPQSKYIFEHSAVSSFLAFLPLYFWRQVLFETNQYARQHQMALGKEFTIDELMKFLGILFYMALTDKGEYANYWGEQVEDKIFGSSSSTGLDCIMTLRRFKLFGEAFCFRSEVSPELFERDGAARIRSVLNLLKTTCGKYVEAGRDIALDEASIACRSKFGRKLIVYNPKKPSGKYHFKLYVVCCSTTWLVLGYRLHCRSSFADRHSGVVAAEEASMLADKIAEMSTIRQHVLEVVQPFYFSNRIINTDNYYTSIQLLEALRVKGLYGRGTVRGNSKHFPKHVVLDKVTSVRGDVRQGVSVEHQITTASWCNGSIVTIVSSADASTMATVSRLTGGDNREYPSPVCVKNYNANMQGVDRHDQLRARFSIANGHSFKKWHKKLSLAMIDIARCNAVVSRKMVLSDGAEGPPDRDFHRAFMIDLVHELLFKKWKDTPTEDRIAYGHCGGAPSERDFASLAPSMRSARSTPSASEGSPVQLACKTVLSKQLFSGQNKKRRWCVVCKWEGRSPTLVTDYCIKHCVCLCQMVHNTSSSTYKCNELTWTCWEKFHRFYLPRKLFNDKGNLRTSSALYKKRQTPTATKPTRAVARAIAL